MAGLSEEVDQVPAEEVLGATQQSVEEDLYDQIVRAQVEILVAEIEARVGTTHPREVEAITTEALEVREVQEGLLDEEEEDKKARYFTNLITYEEIYINGDWFRTG